MNNSPDLTTETTHQQQRYLDPEKSYHFFISYRDIEEDNFWVRNLITALQNYGFICLDHRADFIGGQNIFRNINEAVRGSMKTLVILSKHYADSDFCQYELQCILQMSMASKENLIIPVLREKCCIPECLNFVTYIDATGTDNKWILQIIKAFEKKVIERTYYQQLNPVRHYRNLDKVHTELTTVSCFQRMPFKLKRYLPESLNDPSIQITLKTFHGILETLSNSSFIKWGRLCILESVGKCCASILIIFWVALYCLFLLTLIFRSSVLIPKNMTEFVLGMILLSLYPFCSIWFPYAYIVQQNVGGIRYVSGIFVMNYSKGIKMTFCVLDELVIITTLTVNILPQINLSNYGMFMLMFICFIYTTAIFPWFFFWYRKQSQGINEKLLREINKELMDCNLLLTYKVDECCSKIYIFFVYFDCKECLNYIEDYLAKEDRKKKGQSTVIDCDGDRIATDIAMFKLMIKDEANQWIHEMASRYIKDFIEEKLENSASPRHTKRAICLCEYVERHWNINITSF